MGKSFLVEGGVGEGLVEEGREVGLGETEVEQAQVVPGPRGRVGGDAEAARDATGDGRPDVAEDTVEIETTQHTDEVIDGV